jgi:hypothetical protein
MYIYIYIYIQDPVKSPKKRSKSDGSIACGSDDDNENISMNAITVIQKYEEGQCGVHTEESGTFKTIISESLSISNTSSNVMTLNAIEDIEYPQEESLSTTQSTPMTFEEAERRALDR